MNRIEKTSAPVLLAIAVGAAVGAALPSLRVAGAPRVAERPPRLVIVLPTGRLAPGEVSAGSGADGRWARDLAESGWAVPSVEAPPAKSRSLDALRSLIVGDTTRAALAAAGVRTVDVDLADRDALRAFLAPPPPAQPAALARIEEIFGNPQEANDEESAAVRALSGALGRDPPPAPARSVAPARGTSGKGLAARIADVEAASVAVVRIAAEGDSPGEVRERAEVLGRLDAIAGSDGTLIVAAIPEAGDGSILLRGPGLEGGWIFARRKPFAALAAVVETLVGTLEGKPSADLQARKERIRAILQ